jgi:C4-dicarboxylate-specific signal transduction histidine kinase
LQSDLAIDQVTVETELDEALPLVLGNLVQLQQVILNLVLNAIDAMHDVDHVDRAIKLTTAPDSVDGRVVVAVCDSGPGVDRAISNKIFGPFFTTKKDGMGMGLPITRSIVEAHGGRLSVRNNAEKGCTFSVVLPIGQEGSP